MVDAQLAQAAPTRDMGSVLLWAGLLLVGVAVLVRVLQVFRRRFRADRDEEGLSLWSLHDLREMHARGDLTEDEYERLQARLLEDLGAGQAAGPGPDALGSKRQ